MVSSSIRLAKSSTRITSTSNNLSPIHKDLSSSSEQGKGWKLRKALAQTRAVVKDYQAGTPSVDQGREVHFAIMKAGCEGEALVGTALINMYGKCGSLADARTVFQCLPKRDVVTWNVMISVCAQTGHGTEALQLFDQMQCHGCKPNKITYVSALNACGSLAALEKGQEIHSAIANSGCESEVVVGTTLIHMYGKCGALQEATNVFLRLPQRNLVSWNAMIAAYAQNGHGKEALDFFGEMQSDGFRPDQFTFLSVLAACRHTGHVDDAKHYFVSMNQDHGIKPDEEHYLCLIDILGRAGHLDDAENLISFMPFRNVARAWLYLLAACRLHGDVERGVRAADHVFKLDPDNLQLLFF
ncbi:hypothetical protein O6H91_20G010100 [Diphasiastrum complanatum]|uniref:Uncharacterized protein n=1 Tax=Diphasiastrum complanatum TaxID=34168 RepID=A0ACC2AMP2_DIPCM|nr:hypothetical protein O6H91_20G010100 [Diphasiastrum complanatum]